MEEANLANGNFLYSMLFYTIINSKYTAVYLIKECNTLLDSKKEYIIAAVFNTDTFISFYYGVLKVYTTLSHGLQTRLKINFLTYLKPLP